MCLLMSLVKGAGLVNSGCRISDMGKPSYFSGEITELVAEFVLKYFNLVMVYLYKAFDKYY